MASKQDKALQRYEEMVELYVQLGYHLQMLSSQIEDGHIEAGKAEAIENNLDGLMQRTRSINYYLEE